MNKLIQVCLLLLYCVFSVICFESPYPPEYYNRRPGPQGTCQSDTEQYSNCGNICENSCDNLGEPPIDNLNFGYFGEGGLCESGCYCKLHWAIGDFIRDENGECVLYTADTCCEFHIIKKLFHNIQITA
jgi:hypothetical protein